MKAGLVFACCSWPFRCRRRTSSTGSLPLAKEIDRRVNEKLKAQHVAAVPQADDAAFFRRINLALAGRIPARRKCGLSSPTQH